MRKKDYIKLVRSMGCMVCGDLAEIHHIRSMSGMSQRATSFLVVPLCSVCHRTGPDAIHQSTRNERELLSKTIEKVVTMLENNQMPF